MRIQINDKNNFMNLFNKIFPDYKISKINGISIDSRKIQENDIFIPLKGENCDGAEFIENVLKINGTICLHEKENKNKRIIQTKSNKDFIIKFASLWRKRIKSKIIAITGSNGKTTSKELLFHIINKKYNCNKSIGNYNSTIGLPLSLISCDINHKYIILELGANKKGEIKKLCKIIKPDYSLITNISNAHIKNYNSIQEITQNKAEIFYSLSKKSGIAFVNLDDKEIKKIPLNSQSISYGINNNKAKYNAVTIDSNTLNINGFNINISDKISHLKEIILSIYTISRTLGISNLEFQNYINSFTPLNGRGNIISINNYKIIDDAYNANPSSMYYAINRLNKIDNKRKIIILGDMLELGKHKYIEHQKVGRYINKFNFDIVFTYGNYSYEIYKSLNNNYKIKKHFSNMNVMKKEFKKIVKKDDLVLIKGSRSMQLERLYK